MFTIEELNSLLNAEERAIKKKFEPRDTAMAMILQSGINQNNNKGRGIDGNQRGRGRGFNNFVHNFRLNNGQSILWKYQFYSTFVVFNQSLNSRIVLVPT